MEVAPLNHRAKWTKNEEKQLIKETKMKIDIKKIAENHKRTIGAIKFKLIRYVIDLIDIEPTITLKELLEITNLSKEELFDGFKKVNYHYEEFIEEDEDDFKKDIKEIKRDISAILTIIITALFAVNIYLLIFYNLLKAVLDGFTIAQ